MRSLSNILQEKKVVLKEKPAKKRRGNWMYGIACELQRRLDLPLPMCFRLLKKHTPKELYALVSWWKDYPYKKESNIGLLYWKLKQLYPEKYAKK